MALQKIEKFPGVTKLAPANIETQALANALEAAAYEFDLQMHDLKSEFIHREGKLRQDFLDRVAQITAGAAQ